MLTTDRRRTTRDERGLSLAVMSLLLVGLLAMAGLVVDLGTWQVEASRIRQAADAAALAGVVRLPDGDAAAEARAIDVAADNGYVHGDDGVTVVVEPQGDESLRVTITKTDVAQYFSQVVRDGQSTTITRTSTAQYVQPVPLGSPRNYLGTGNLLLTNPLVAGDGVENFWLSVSGQCTRREYGDRITPIAMAIPEPGNPPPYTCLGPDYGALERLPNPEHDSRGYLFGVTVPEASGSVPVDIQMFDAPTCTSSTNRSRAGDEPNATFDVTVTVREDALDPYTGTPLVAPKTFRGSADTSGDCGLGPVGLECVTPTALRSCWTTLATVNAPGNYFVQVNPEFAEVDSRHDNFSLRAKRGGVFVPCTGDASVPAGSLPPYDATCPNVYGTEHLPVFANVPTGNPVFFLASIDSRHNGKTMEVTLYDAAEGATGIELLNPLGGAETFDWTVLCANGSEPSGNSCPDETPPIGGRSGGGVSVLPTADDVCTDEKCPQPFAANTQTGKYSDRLIRLSVKLPASMETAYEDPVTGQQRTWWKIRYTGNFGGDRTTWSVKLLGDPVRLIPNN